MQLSTHEANGIYVIGLNGRIVADTDTMEFKDTVRDALISGKKKVVVDMGGVDWINSTGIAALIQGYSMMKEVDGQLRLARLTEAVTNVLTINKLNLVLYIHPTVDDAIAAATA